MPHAQRDKECQSAHPAAKHLTQKLRRRQHKLRSGRACGVDGVGGVVPSAMGRYVGRGARRICRHRARRSGHVRRRRCAVELRHAAGGREPVNHRRKLCKLRHGEQSGKVAFELGAAPIKRIRCVRPQRAAIREWRQGTHEHRLRPHDLLVQRPKCRVALLDGKDLSGARMRQLEGVERDAAHICPNVRVRDARHQPRAHALLLVASRHQRKNAAAPATGVVERVWRVGGRSFPMCGCDDVMTPLSSLRLLSRANPLCVWPCRSG